MDLRLLKAFSYLCFLVTVDTVGVLINRIFRYYLVRFLNLPASSRSRQPGLVSSLLSLQGLGCGGTICKPVLLHSHAREDTEKENDEEPIYAMLKKLST